MQSIIEISNIKKNYYNIDGETEAIKDFSLNVEKNEFISIIGSSGCGKSTILNIIGKLDKQTDGIIKIKDNIKIGYMLQQDCLFDWLNIYENAILGLKIRKELTIDNINYVKSLLKKYGLLEFIYKYPSELSGGMRQRVALIRTLATKPDVLLLDEPFSALDYQTRLKVSDDVYKIIKNENKTVIMVTHDIAEAISLSNKVIVMSKRPSIIKNIYNIELENKKNPIENRKDKNFSYYYDILWKDLDDCEV